MNYIKQLNAAFEKFYFDDRLNPTHISLYMALFQEWNSSRFANDFFVNRRDLMKVAKIGSKSTYHRCVTDLDTWKYLSYFPSNNPYKGSKIKMTIIGTGDEPDEGHYDPKLEQLAERYHSIQEPVVHRYPPNNEQAMYSQRPLNGLALVSTINNTKLIKHNKQPNSLEVVLNFFKDKDLDPDYAKTFFEYYQDRDWLTSDGLEVRDWRALALYWAEKKSLARQKKKLNKHEVSRFRDNLRTTKNKDYGQPL
ncbi:hypothetical protein APR41_05400 [Salegentibacter salinarum]|uniref:Uncharacterized protein n=1 Tax=Salegentibacter salinarum TaxID=447422 RepID=A0A2N0TSG1_9FLAO|nr:hypothetical protein [Salegentibacter salinarum]PKD17646.1 hypothetical protein APR41_05400 [Salegentibacter salinarum]SKB50284.1 hypothetical protein SAMN05660903_01106 [Salegentibacter salinarum]